MMFLGLVITLGASEQSWIAQIPNTAESTLILSGSQGFLILIAGLFLAFAFQLLLTNFFVAMGISYAKSGNDSHTENQASQELDDKINQVGTIVGLPTLATFSMTLFIACFLAIKLCPVDNLPLGAILGLVIWAAYFSLLVWVSATTVGSVIGTVVNTATSGLQGILGTAAVALGAKTVSDQFVSTAEAAASAVRHELSTAVDRTSTREAIDNYLKKLQLSAEDRDEIRIEFEKLVDQPEMKSITKENQIRDLGRQTFVDSISSRTNFSKEDVTQALNQVEGVWQMIWGQQPETSTNGGLLNVIKPAVVDELKSTQLSPKLEELIEYTRKQQAAKQAEAAQKVAETATWWLFGTAFVSACSSAIAGVLSIRY